VGRGTDNEGNFSPAKLRQYFDIPEYFNANLFS
jgi:hypothetical protein